MPRPPTPDPRPPTLPTTDAPLTPSKSQRKRDAQALQALGGELLALSAAQLARLDLPEALHEAVLAVRRMRAHGARTRHLQSIGKVMRQLESTALSRVRAALTSGRAGTPPPQPSTRKHRAHVPARLPSRVSSHASQRTTRPCLLPDHSGGHVASSSPHCTRELPHGPTRAGAVATQRSHHAGRGPAVAREVASRSASRMRCHSVCWPAAAVSTGSVALAAAC